MTRIRSDDGNLTRRSVVKGVAAGGAAVAIGSVSVAAFAAGPGLAKHSGMSKPLRRDDVRVAAVQMNSSRHSGTDLRSTTGEMIRTVSSVQAQTNGLDLVVFPGRVLPGVHRDSPGMEALKACAVAMNCYLSCGTCELRFQEDTVGDPAFIVFEPDGSIQFAPQSQLWFVATDIGTLAVVSGPHTSGLSTRLETAGTDIIIRDRESEYSAGSLHHFTPDRRAYSVVVADTDHHSDDTTAATAIYDGNGNALSLTGPGWTQTVIAKLPIGRLRAVRQT